MPQELKPALRDKDLEVATWLYARRPVFAKAALFIFTFIGGILFLVLIVSFGLYAAGFPGHRAKLIQATQNMILAEDPALPYVPQDLTVKTINIVKHRGQGVDFLAEIVNPNQNWQAISFDYNFATSGKTLPNKTSFALPGVKYLADFTNPKPLASLGFRASQVSLNITNIKWRKIKSSVDKERLGLLKIVVEKSQFVPGDKKEIIDAAKAAITNNTPFGFWKINVIAVVYKDSKILAVGQSGIENLASGETKEIEIGLGILETNQVDQIKIFPQVNILDPESIMRT
jgi:hypothetical protein